MHLREFTSTYGKFILICALIGLVMPMFLFLLTGMTEYLSCSLGGSAGLFLLALFFSFVSYIAR